MGRGKRARAAKAGGPHVESQCSRGDADGKLAISASDDQTLNLWDVASGNKVCTFTADVGITACATALDGAMIVAGDGLGRSDFLALERMAAAGTVPVQEY